MQLRVIYGWHLDSARYPEEPALGQLTVGPLGFAHQLALRLGLLKKFQPQAVRISEFLYRLKALDDGHQFFSASFKTDPWGTSRALLQLRDEIISAGWTPQTAAAGSARLATLAKVEMLRSQNLVSLIDMLAQIAQALETGRKVAVESVALVEPIEQLPPIWRRIIHALETSGVDVSVIAPRTVSSGDLGRLSTAIKSGARNCQLVGDGSFTLVESDDEVQAADFFADWLGHLGEDKSKTAIIRGNSTSYLDQILRKRGLPALGNGTSSALRGYAQLLPLALELCWNPLNPVRLLELLSLPQSPIPAYAASCFKRALLKEPGIGGPEWQEAWKIALERRANIAISDARKGRSETEHREPSDEAELRSPDDQGGEDVSPEISKVLEDTKAAWVQWLEPKTAEPSVGIPKDELIAVCARIRSHANKLAAYRNEEVFAQTSAWAETLAHAVETTGFPLVTRAQLDRMLDSVMGTGYEPTECGASEWTPLDHPGQIYGTAKNIAWWGFVSESQPIRSNPWTLAEIKYLREHGIELETPAARAEREAWAWRRPFANAERVLLIKPRTVTGTAVAVHPFYHELVEYIEKLPSLMRSLVTKQAHELFERRSSEICAVRITRTPAAAASLPEPKMVWDIDGDLVVAKTESPTSLERLLGCPLSWLLHSVARLRKGAALSMPDSEQVSGNLAHAVFANIFGGNTTRGGSALRMREAELRVFAEKTFDNLCPKFASVLLLPGKSLERKRLRHSISDSVVHLAGILKAAGFDDIKCETDLELSIDDTHKFAGRADMLLRGNDTQIILDLKYAKRAKFKRKDIADGRAIQLALYAAMAEAAMRAPESPTPAASNDRETAQRIIESSLSPSDAKTNRLDSPDTVPANNQLDVPTPDTVLPNSPPDVQAGYYMIAQKQLFTTASQPFPEHCHVPGPSLAETYRLIADNYKTHLSYLTSGTAYATGLIEPIIAMDETEPQPSACSLEGVNFGVEPPCKFCDFGRLCGKKELA